MRIAVLAITGMLAALSAGSPWAASEPPKKDTIFTPDMEAMGVEEVDGSLSILVRISQRAIIYEGKVPSEYLYHMYFQDHIFQNGELCVSGPGSVKPNLCTRLSTLLTSSSAKVRKRAKALQQRFVKLYEQEVRPVVENQIREELAKLKPDAPPALPEI